VLDELPMNKTWIVYLLCCSDGKIYTGVTNDLEKRLEAHNKGTASRFTRARLPVTLLATSRLIEKEDAFRLEYRIKRLSREKKLKAIKDG
jgi:putative endonuclease